MPFDMTEAVNRFTEINVSYGDFISHNDTKHILQMDDDYEDRPADMNLYRQWIERQQWDLLNRFTTFRDHMLEEHLMLLVNVRGQGYRIANPSEHAEIAARQFAQDVEKAGRNARKALDNVNSSLMSASENARHAEVLVRVSGLQVHIKQNIPAYEKYQRKQIGDDS